MIFGAVLMALAASNTQAPPPVSTPTAAPRVVFDERTIARILQHAPLPAPPADPTNRVADDPRAATLGQALFFDARLSQDGKVSCATCHDPARAFTDGRAVSRTIAPARRNAPSLYNVAQQRWLFWDGRADSLWSQALQPIENPVEMGGDRRRALRVVADDAALRARYELVFGALPAAILAPNAPRATDPPVPERANDAASTTSAAADEIVDRAFANLGKSIAAYERQLVSANSPFDRFAAALRANDTTAQAAYPDDARRGLALFVGKADCRLCHAGPLFSDGEFHDVGVPTYADPLAPATEKRALAPLRDPGRREGVEKLRADPFRASGAFSDAPDGERARELDTLTTGVELHAQVRTPSLRNVARTAPYMHQGQFATLDDVIAFYSTRDGAVPTGHHAEAVLRPLGLTADESRDLKAFLESLTDESLPPERTRAPR